jgi:uncharacterized protein YbjT (DUF2867 family)
MTNKILRKALVLGATGLVGRELLNQLLVDDYFSKVKILVRRSTGIVNPKLEEVIIDFDSPESWASELVGDVIFSAFGTTLKQAGSKEAQYKIDYHYQYTVIRLAFENSVPDCVLVSAPGASIVSKIFYNRMKGELDRDVAKLGFDRLVLIKPSLLLGKRDEVRMGESVGAVIGSVMKWIPGLRKYRPIPGSVVATSMIHSVKNPSGHPITQYHSDQLFQMT